MDVWYDSSIEKFKDMKKVAEEFKKLGVRPGIWFRPLKNTKIEEEHPDWCLVKGPLKNLDPSHPEVKKLIKEDIARIKSWGYELIKHDFTFYDANGSFSTTLKSGVTNHTGWSFYDKKKTGAEIVLDFYKLIREAAGDMYIIGCCTISHLSAGLVELYRIGNDTSGKCWSVTRTNGVNALAFRICQNDIFYKVDADCVGLMGDNIPWKLNRQWLDLLAKSGSPLFVSMQPSAITDEIKKDLKEAFKINSVQKEVLEPLDWMHNNQPHKWLIDGKETEYDFIMDSLPKLIGYKIGTITPEEIF